MTKLLLAAVTVALAGLAFLSGPPRRVVQLPRGEMLLHSPIALDGNTELRGAPEGTVLRAATDFAGAAMVVVRGAGVRLRDFTVDGNRAALEARTGLPPYDTPFARFTRSNGVLAANVTGLTIQNVHFREIAGFAVLVSNSHAVAIDRVTVADSGSRNPAGRNNATGGILLEEGTTDFRVSGCELRSIRGNGIWTHSLYTSPRNERGAIALNVMTTIGRDAIQVGHARGVRVQENTAALIGFPEEDVDIEGGAIPVAIDTAGNVENCAYEGNQFSGINGKCLDLDGFHDGEIRGNACVNGGAARHYRFGNYAIVMNNSNPDMQSRNIRVVENTVDGALFGGVFVIGTGHRIERNRLRSLNLAHYGAGQPDMLRSGIYFGMGAERPAPARGNIVEGNEITGYGIEAHCVVSAPGLDPQANTVRGNICRDVDPRR